MSVCGYVHVSTGTRGGHIPKELEFQVVVRCSTATYIHTHRTVVDTAHVSVCGVCMCVYVCVCVSVCMHIYGGQISTEHDPHSSGRIACVLSC